MLKIVSILIAIAFLLALSEAKFTNNVNGGSPCVICSVLVGLVEQLSIVYNTTVEESLFNFCDFFPKDSILKFTCDQAVNEYAKVIIDGLYANASADVICHTLKFCRTDPGLSECHIFPLKNGMSIKRQKTQLEETLVKRYVGMQIGLKTSPCDEPIFKPICEFFNRSFNNHDASVDLDKDGFSTYETLRGTNWKGKDCNDLSSKVYPGAKSRGNDTLEDTNCNGIYGIGKNEVPYEDLFCKNSQQRGFAVLGDSISAHFHIPEQWLDATTISQVAFQHAISIIENELDWPQLSAATGHIQNEWPVVVGNTSSIYLKLWQRNKCNFRDYQNVAVNGARTGSMLSDIVESLSRAQSTDQPLIVFYSLVGNDVCNGHPDTFNHMTTLQEMHDNVLQTMQYLDTKLPSGSHILLTGLANGSMLYDLVGNRVYPLGRVKNDVLYSDMYTYLSCMQISPCNGWLTTNATEREMTTAYAVQLSQVVKNITQSYKFNNFDMLYIDFPFDEVIGRWVAQGGEPWQLIEPIDGFHVNQFAHPLIADTLWDFMLKNVPDWLGPINPFNDAITQIFGDQGGY